MNKLAVLSVLVVVLLAGMVSCAAPEEPEQPSEVEQPAEEEEEATPPSEEELEKFTIKFSDDAPETSGWSKKAIQPWGDYVENISQGRCTVEFYPSSALHSNKDAYMAVQTGITDMNKLWHPAMPGTFPLMDMFSLPGVMPGQIVVNTQVVNDLYDRWPEFEAQYSDQVEWIYSTVVMGSNIHSIEPIRNLDELQGKVISCTSEPAAQALNLLGASATVITDGAEIYLALERGVIDGAFAAWAWVTGYNIRDVADHHLMIQLSPGSVGYVMRTEAFEKFTDHEQYLLKQYRHTGSYNSNHGAIVGAAMVAQGGIPPEQVYNLSEEDRAAMQEALLPLWGEWVADAEAKGYPAQDILDDCLLLVKGYRSD